VRFVDGAGIASNKRGAVTINGAVSIGGLFKLWDIATVSFSGGLSVDSGATLQLNQNLDLSSVTTVFNGNFSKTVNNNESTTLTLGAVTVSSSTTPTISAGTIVLSGTVTVSDGATFTIPASGVTVSGATFDLAAVNSVLVAPESLSVNVDTSVDGKIVKHVTDAGNTTYSVADAVATFGGTPYGSIANAIEAAVAASGGTVTLVDNSSEDITLPNGVSFCDGGYTYTGEITTDTANHVYYNTTTDAGVTTYSALSAEASVTANAVTTYYATFDAAKAVAGANTITLLTDITINVAENDTLTISSPIAGSFGITKTGAGTLVLSGYNTYTGATTIDSGVLDLQNAIHANNTTYEVAATAKLRLAASTGFVATSVTLRGTLEVASTAQVVQIPVLNAYNGSHIKYTASQAVIVGSMAMLDEGSVAIDISDALGAEGATLRLIQITNASLNVVSLGDVPTGYILGLSGTNAIIAYIPVATIGGTPYQTLSDAFSAASNGDTITLTRNDNSAINIHRKSITFVEDGGVFTGTFASEYDAYGTYGTLILTELLESADTNTLFENGGWAGTVVLPNGLPASNLNLNHYGARYNNQGHSWSTVQIQGIDSGHLANATVDPIVELVGNMRLTSCSQSFANTFEVVKGAGDFDLSAAELSGGSTYAYFLLKNVANFTGSLKTKAGGAGIVLGGTTKPTGTDDLGKIIVNTAATIGAGETWVAPGGVRVSEGVVVTMGAGGSISGTVTLKVGASVKIPDGTAAPTVTTDVPYYTVTSTTVAGVTTYTIVKKPGTIFSVY
jgi:autotransporter-associated beta strand protein